MLRTVQIAPSILSAHPLNLERDVRLIMNTADKPEWLHIDVMDGHFVPNLTIGPAFVKALKKITDVRLDVHLMVNNPAAQLDWYLNAGADLVTVQVESPAVLDSSAIMSGGAAPSPGPGTSPHQKGTSFTVFQLTDSQVDELTSMLARIRRAGALAGVALNPDTPAEILKPLYGCFDVVMVMSVHPGFAGQSFISTCAQKIASLAADRAAMRENPVVTPAESAADFLIEVDGGIDTLTISSAVEAGADMLVAGNAVFGAADPLRALADLRSAIADALTEEASTVVSEQGQE